MLFSNNGAPLHELNGQACFIANNKQYCKRFFQRLGIFSPQGLIFQDFDQEQDRLVNFMQVGQPYVYRLLDGTEGKGVYSYCPILDNLVRFLEENRQNGLENS